MYVRKTLITCRSLIPKNVIEDGGRSSEWKLHGIGKDGSSVKKWRASYYVVYFSRSQLRVGNLCRSPVEYEFGKGALVYDVLCRNASALSESLFVN